MSCSSCSWQTSISYNTPSTFLIYVSLAKSEVTAWLQWMTLNRLHMLIHTNLTSANSAITNQLKQWRPRALSVCDNSILWSVNQTAVRNCYNNVPKRIFRDIYRLAKAAIVAPFSSRPTVHFHRITTFWLFWSFPMSSSRSIALSPA